MSIKANSASKEAVSITIGANKKDTKPIKDFVNSYNELLEKLQTAYNKPSAKTYMPLSEQEKEVMTDREIEKWEQTGKENILSKDSSLNTIINLLKDFTGKEYNIDGQNISLASIGISTTSYFNTSADKRGSLEVDEEKLQNALNNDPETVNKLIKAVGKDLYDKLSNNSKSSSSRSIYSFYNDKEILKQIEEKKKKVDEWDAKLRKIEDKYYKQFSAMETALAKMSNQSSALMNMFSN